MRYKRQENRLLISGIIMFIVGIAMALVSSFVVLGLNNFAFYMLFVFGCITTLVGFIVTVVGICYEGY